jgi:UDP-N-acetylmuramoylalanine--D-glutamate ligase
MSVLPSIAIWGMGVSGKALYGELLKLGIQTFAVDQKKIEDISEEYFVSENLVTQAWLQKNQIKTIVVSPGIDTRGPHWTAIKNEVEVIGDVEFVLRKTSVKVIAVTGTNGKSTTVNLISSLLTLAGVEHFLGGNWGVPVAKLLDAKQQYQYAVLELSSFQLETFKQSAPIISVLLNLSVSHMERYHSFQDYIDAKCRIFKQQKSLHCAIVAEDLKEQLVNELSSVSAKVSYFSSADMDLFNFRECKLLGEHNRKNLAATYCVGQALRLPNLEGIFQQLITTFKPVNHRLEICEQYKDSIFINDSKSTNVTSTMTALKSLTTFDPSFQVHLLLGGKPRSEDYSFLNELRLAPNQSMVIWAFGAAATGIEKQIAHYISVKKISSLDEFFHKDLLKIMDKKNIILLSPAFPSYDQYKNFEHRGDHFKNLVKAFCQSV